ncbi:tetratricopeptide repeat protein [Argonema antarcticum]|uniref:tetratricopeptide repeat protein n=1 Tax=Argonema antarcticum TaxID=2942763 RepID=UPI0020119153|nr:hypothetical protein [Argonema antarcticum]MCL1473464.1 hypothetical protein [Argonema antarcticum A004/B2]
MKLKISLFSILATVSLVIALILTNVDWTIATVGNNPVGRIIVAENDSQITAGKLLYVGDTLQPKSAANVVVLCYNNGQTWNLPTGNVSRVSDRCQPPTQGLDCTDRRNGCRNDDGRSPIRNPNTPYIISPYKTDLINDRPPISWQIVPGITDYTVRIQDITGSGVNWERIANTTDNEIKWNYPPDVEPLQPGRKYKLIVEAKTESPEKLAAPGEAIFAMLKKEDIKQVRDVVDRINKLSIPKEEKSLQDLYSIYHGKNLISEIQEMLESLVKDGSQTAQVHRKLGDIYFKQGLLELAKSRYGMAIKLAKIAGDTVELEKAQTGFDRVNEAQAF